MFATRSEDVQRLFVPLEGTYIAVTIDPEETFKLYDRQVDKETRRVLMAFPRRTYVGYCSYGLRLPNPDNAFNKLSFCPLQHGLTTPIPDQRITADMCAPVSPELEHPRNRPPLETNKPLPWTGCYHPTCMSFYVWLTKRWIDYSSSYEIETIDRCKMMLYADEDAMTREGVVIEHRESTLEEIERSAALEREWREHDDLESLIGSLERYEDEEEPSSDAMLFPCHDIDDGCSFATDWSNSYSEDGDIGRELREANFDEGKGTSDGENKQPQEGDANEYGEDHPNVVIPVVRFTPDLSGVNRLYNAIELEEDVLLLQKLMEQALARARAKEPATLRDSLARSDGLALALLKMVGKISVALRLSR